MEDASLLVASGLAEPEGNFKSVPAMTIYRRCRRAFKPFNEKKAEAFTRARNDYLHGAGIAFSAIPEDVWWADFWSLASTLIDAQDKDIDNLVGRRRATIVERHLQNNKKYIVERTESLVGRARIRFDDKNSGRIPAARLGRWKSQLELQMGLNHSISYKCPACEQEGLLEADDVENMRIVSGDYDDGEPRGLADALGIYFSCAHCQLVLDGWDLLDAAGIDSDFEVEDPDFVDQVSAESEYGNE